MSLELVRQKRSSPSNVNEMFSPPPSVWLRTIFKRSYLETYLVSTHPRQFLNLSTVQLILRDVVNCVSKYTSSSPKNLLLKIKSPRSVSIYAPRPSKDVKPS